MTYRKLLYFFLVVICNVGFSQLNYPTGIINVNTTPGVGIVEEKRSIPEKSSNELYLDESWEEIVVSINESDKNYKYPARIDILNDRVELKDSGTLKVIQGQFIKYLLIKRPGQKDRFIIRNGMFENPANHPSGFYEVLTEGNINLLRLYGFVRLEPSYNPALDVGNKSAQIRQNEEMFIMKNNLVQELPSRKKDIYSLLGESAGKVAQENKLNPKREDELIQLIRLLNN